MPSSPNPYDDLPPEAFWKAAVAGRGALDLADIWRPRFPIRPDEPIVTFGSCFAQHIGRALLERGFRWLDAEPPPPTLSDDHARQFGYRLFSARTGNIYTTSLLSQWVRWAQGIASPKECWEDGRRFFDPFRPAIEPDGFGSRAEMVQSRNKAIAAFRTAIMQARCFVFTLGLTEGWRSRSGRVEYPLCPGTAAGRFDPDDHQFLDQGHAAVVGHLRDAVDAMRTLNPALRFLFTVSPVPLVATATGRHVLIATLRAKAVLRAAVDTLVAERDDADYFPSYELISSPTLRGIFFEPNLRAVSPQGVAHVMEHFFRPLGPEGAPAPTPSVPTRAELRCEEELLEAFGR